MITRREKKKKEKVPKKERKKVEMSCLLLSNEPNAAVIVTHVLVDLSRSMKNVFTDKLRNYIEKS